MDHEDQPDIDVDAETISLDDTLASLKRNADSIQIYLQESLKKCKAFQHRLAEESKNLAELPLQPKTRLMKWLTDHGLPVECTFQDFFEAFVDEHKKEHRLDLTTRSIQLNSAASILFGYKDTNPWVPIYDLMEKLSVLYY